MYCVLPLYSVERWSGVSGGAQRRLFSPPSKAWVCTNSNRVLWTPLTGEFGVTWGEVFLERFTCAPRMVRKLGGLLYFMGSGDGSIVTLDPSTLAQGVFTGFDSPYDVVPGDGGKVFAVQLGLQALKEIPIGS